MERHRKLKFTFVSFLHEVCVFKTSSIKSYNFILKIHENNTKLNISLPLKVSMTRTEKKKLN
jgi:hypothetical protein